MQNSTRLIKTRNNTMRKLIWQLYLDNEITMEVADKILDKYYE